MCVNQTFHSHNASPCGFIVKKSFENHIFFLYHPAEVYQSIAHTPEGSVDANLGLLGNLLEGQTAVVAQPYDLLLLLGKLHNESSKVLLDLLAHHSLLYGALSKSLCGNYIVASATLVDTRVVLLGAEVVDDLIVGYAHNPREELAALLVAPAVDDVHHFDKGFLKYIVSQVAVFDHHTDVVIDAHTVTFDELGDSLFVACKVSGEQLVVAPTL